MASRALDKKCFKQQMNYIVLVQIGNHFIQFVMTFLVRPSTKATQPVLLFWTLQSPELKIELFIQHLIYWSRFRIITKMFQIDLYMFLILLKIIQLCLTKCSQGYDSGESSRDTHVSPLVQYYMGIHPFWPYFPQSSHIYIYFLENKTDLPTLF